MNFGVEVEFTGVKRIDVASKLAKEWNSSVTKSVIYVNRESRERLEVEDPNGYVWFILIDKSIDTENVKHNESVSDFQCELVSPVLNEKELGVLYQAVDFIKQIGGRVNSSCGVHIHVDCPHFQDLCKILEKFFDIQDTLLKLFCIPKERLIKYCKRYSPTFIEEYKSRKFSDTEELLDFFYEKLSNGMVRSNPKNALRYYMLNLDSISKIGTVEFRMFNASLQSNTIKDYIEWVRNFVND